ncbi:MAG TPA: YafY family protein [Arachidicoccus sp.]|nr:YafY family protein [Arachidicoccus sp.]
MNETDTKRLSRLVAIITLLQSKRVVTSTSLAEKFGVSIRTIYRDIKALDQAGIPILTQEGKGYYLMEGYRMPPVMFTENEAGAFITTEQLVLKNSDSSLIKEYTSGVNKIKAVLLYSTKQKAALLAQRIAVNPTVPQRNSSNSLAIIQNALTSFQVLNILYRCEGGETDSRRKIEPFALYYSQQEYWTLIAFCRLRKDYRMFRLDRILHIEPIEAYFKPHKLTLDAYLQNKEKQFGTPDIPLS